MVPEIPIVLPKLCVVITAVCSVQTAFKSLTFRTLFEDTVIAEASVPAEQLEEAMRNTPRPQGADPANIIAKVGAQLAMSPFPITKAGVLRVRVQTEAEELKAPALRIQLAPQREAL